MARKKKKKRNKNKPVYYAPSKKEKKTVAYKQLILEYTGGRRNNSRSYRCFNKTVWIPESYLKDIYKLKKDACIDNILRQAGLDPDPPVIPDDKQERPAYPSYQPPEPLVKDIYIDKKEDTTEYPVYIPKNPNQFVYIPAKKPYSIIMKISFLKRIGMFSPEHDLKRP